MCSQRQTRVKEKEERRTVLAVPPRWLDISVDKLTSNRILLRGGGRKRGEGGREERRENWEYPGHEEAKKGDRKQVRSRLERGTTISCFSSEIRRAAIAPPSAWQTRAILMNTSYLFFCHRSHKPLDHPRLSRSSIFRLFSTDADSASGVFRVCQLCSETQRLQFKNLNRQSV